MTAPKLWKKKNKTEKRKRKTEGQKQISKLRNIDF